MQKENTIIVGDVRISVLSDRTLRIEKGSFTDKRTQFAFCRNYANPQFKHAKTVMKCRLKRKLALLPSTRKRLLRP